MSGSPVRALAFLGASLAFGSALILVAVVSGPSEPLVQGVLLGFLAGAFGASAFWFGVTVRFGTEPRPSAGRVVGDRQSPPAVNPEEAKRLLQTFLATKKPPGN